MKVKMIVDARGSANASGNATKIYQKEEILDCKESWQEDLAKIFVSEGQAQELKAVEPKETKAKPKAKKKKTTAKSSK
jgi:hypothetical protein